MSRGEIEPDSYFDLATQSGLMKEPKQRAKAGVETDVTGKLAVGDFTANSTQPQAYKGQQ